MIFIRVKTEKTQMKKMQLFVLAGALLLGTQARATMYDITYSDPEGNIGSGSLTASPNGDGSYTIVSGTFALSAGPFAGADASFVSYPNGGVAVLYGGTDFIGVDDLLFPSGTAYVDGDGPIFNDASYPRSGGTGLAFNLYYNGSSYELLFNGYNNQPWATSYSGGTLRLNAVPVPEPTTMVAGAMLLLPFGMSAIRIMRKSPTA
jgi:hypothetical protein